jgi:putative multiple sugar transport system substrate-binding protein
MNKKLMAGWLILLSIILAIAGCSNADKTQEKPEASSSESAANGKVLVGVSMPTKSLQRWNQDGGYLKEHLEKKGYKVDLQFAENKVESQISQIENMITMGAKVLIIAPIDVNALVNVLDSAKAQDIKVISYDRLIMNTDAVDYYATFDNTIIGRMLGEYIVDQLGLKEGKGPYNFEIVSGPVNDTTAVLFNAAVDVVKPYIDEGKLVVRSGQTTMEQTATPNWEEKEAQARMDNILTAFYTDEHLDAVLCLNDSTSLGTQAALKSAGYGTADKPMPILTGQDADIANVKAIIAGEQSMSIFKDTSYLAGKVADMTDAIIKGSEVSVNDTENYHNGKRVVPSLLLESKFVDKNNYKQLLIDSGYYTEDELK